jgi:uncharacterized protein YbaA (DUF1428 family)
MKKGTYIDGYVIAIPKKNTAKYKKMAQQGMKAWMKFGALDYKECMIDDATPKGIELPFGMLTKMKPTETVWFSFITFKSKAHRNEVNKKVMAYFAKKYGEGEMGMPFEMNRFSYGGFKVVVGS